MTTIFEICVCDGKENPGNLRVGMMSGMEDALFGALLEFSRNNKGFADIVKRVGCCLMAEGSSESYS